MSIKPGLTFGILRYLIDIVFHDFVGLVGLETSVGQSVRTLTKSLIQPNGGRQSVCSKSGKKPRRSSVRSNSVRSDRSENSEADEPVVELTKPNRTLSSTTWSCMGCPISSLHLKVDMFTRLFVIIGRYRTRKYF